MKRYPFLEKFNLATVVDLTALNQEIREIEHLASKLEFQEDQAILYTNKSHHNPVVLSQISRIRKGLPVNLSPLHLQEIENTIQVFSKYRSRMRTGGFRKADLFSVHKLLCHSIYKGETPGVLRSRGVNILDWKTDRLLVRCPPPKHLPGLLDDVDCWLSDHKKTHSVIRAFCLHYFICFIHPFRDGNGRTARFCARLLLSETPIFALTFEKELFKTAQRYGSLYRAMLIRGEIRLEPMIRYYLDILRASAKKAR